MKDRHFFADVDLPFHVWVRESDGGETRWVLRHAAELRRGVGGSRAGTDGDTAPGGRAGSTL